MLHLKKVGTLPAEGRDKETQTHAIKTAIPWSDAVDIQGKTLAAEALLTRRELTRYLVEDRAAHCHFTVKGNQKHRLEETAFDVDNRDRKPERGPLDSPDQGRIGTRRVWVTTALNA